MLSASWLQLLVVIFLFGAAARVPWLVYFATAVGAVFGAAEWWRRRSLDGVSYQRRMRYRRGFPGEQLELSIEVENRKPLPLSWLRASDPWPGSISPEGETLPPDPHQHLAGSLVNVYSLRWFERVRRPVTLLLRERGIYPLGPVELESGDLFGIYRSTVERTGQEYVTVFPELLPMNLLQLKADDPFGDRSARRPLFEDPNRTMGVRRYHPEDGFRRIHWPATARTGELQSRVYQPVTARVMAVCLNVATGHQPWLGYSPGLLELMVKAAATLAYAGVQAGTEVGLYSNGCLAHADQPFRIPPGRTPAHLAALLQALAGATPYVGQPFEKFLLRAQAEIPYGASLVILTALLPPSLQDVLLRLRQYRPSIRLYLVGPEPPPSLPGINCLHLPYIEGKDE
jgi:uncharacterized protein (DUF58 family)